MFMYVKYVAAGGRDLFFYFLASKDFFLFLTKNNEKSQSFSGHLKR